MLNYTTWKNNCPLRFIVRDGKRILQAPWSYLENGEVKWVDVPLEIEETKKESDNAE